MKVLQLSYALSSGGGRFVVDLSNELSKDHEVILVQILSNDNKLNAHYLPDVSERIKYVNAVVLPHMYVGSFLNMRQWLEVLILNGYVAEKACVDMLLAVI